MTITYLILRTPIDVLDIQYSGWSLELVAPQVPCQVTGNHALYNWSAARSWTAEVAGQYQSKLSAPSLSVPRHEGLNGAE